MKVKLLCGRSGVDASHRAGEEINVDDAEGLRMIAAGQAELVGVKSETATKKIKTEKAVKK